MGWLGDKGTGNIPILYQKPKEVRTVQLGLSCSFLYERRERAQRKNKQEDRQMEKELELTIEGYLLWQTLDSLPENEQRFIRLIIGYGASGLISDDDYSFLLQYLMAKDKELYEAREKIKRLS